MRPVFAAFAFTALLGLSPAAYAAPAIDETGAAALKETVDGIIAGYIRKSAAEGNSLTTGPVTVVPKGAYYEVRVPDVVAKSADSKIDIGTILLNSAPNDKGAYMTSMALPTSMVMTGKSGKPEYRLTLGSQKFSGAFYPEISTFTKIDAEYKDITLKNIAGKPLTMKIGTIKNILNLTPDADKTYSGFNDATVTDMSLYNVSSDGQRQVTIGVGSVASKNLYEKFDIAGTQQASERLTKLYTEGKGKENPHLQDATKEVMNTLTSMLDGFNNKTEMRNIRVEVSPAPNAVEKKNPDGTDMPPQTPISLKIAEAHSGISARGIRQEKGSLSFTANSSKIEFTPLTEDIAGIMPKNINIDLSFDQLPMKDLSGLLTRFMDQAARATVLDQDTSKKLADRTLEKRQIDEDMKATLGVLPALLSRAGTTFTAKNSFIETRDTLSTLEGVVKARNAEGAAKTLPLQGTMTLTIRGIDEAIANLQKQVAAPNADPRLAPMTQGIMMLQMFGESGKAANGQSLRTYKIEFTPDGKTLMNGADLGAAAGMMRMR